MNSDIRLAVNFWQHPKTIKTIRKYGLEHIRSLQCLWCFCAVNRASGVMENMDEDDIEIAADWNGDRMEFINACLDLHWIDKKEDGLFYVHGWEDRQRYAMYAPAREEKARKAAQARWGKKEEDKVEDKEMPLALQEDDISNAPSIESHATSNAPSIKNNATSNAKHHQLAMLNNASSNAPSPTPSPFPFPKEEYCAKNLHETEIPKDPESDELIVLGKKKTLTGKRAESFNQFWEAFGDKRGKAQAADAWAEIPRLTDALVFEIIEAAKRYAKEREEIKRRGSTPKMAQGWISDRRWEDEKEPEKEKSAFELFGCCIN